VRRGSADRKRRVRGYALLTVMIFALVVTTAGMAFFNVSTTETRQSLYRQRSTEAFYLADGALERARAKMLDDRAWRAGWSNQTAGNGAYDLRIVDTTWSGQSVVKLVGTGRVGAARRRVEAMTLVPPSSYSYALHVYGNASVLGNLCLHGRVHVNGAADFGNNDSHLSCDHVYTEGFAIKPPILYTDPAHFPGTTYYYVKGNKVGSTYQAKIFDRNGSDVTAALGNNLSAVTTYSGGNYTFSFNTSAKLTTFFDDVTGVFHRDAGTSAVVVNFGETPLFPAAGTGVSTVVLDGGGSFSLHATILAARFTGASEAQRTDTNFWRGGTTTVKQITLEPYAGVAIAAYDYQKQGGSLVSLGTVAYPALVYVTRDITALNSNYDQIGSLIVLRNFSSSGGPDITFEEGFVPRLPAYLLTGWQSGVSGTLKVLQWREVVAPGS
jgi:hypothetical protein